MRQITLGKEGVENKVIKSLEQKAGVKLTDCYQCGKCSAGCPVAFAMDLKPRGLIRLLQLGQVDEVLKSRTPWLCATCQCCYARCPNEIKIPNLMEAVRQEAKARHIVPEKDIDRFNNLFLRNVEQFGRSHETFLMGFYNLTTGHLFQDVASAPKLYFSGKIRIRPHLVKDRAGIKRLFRKTLRKGE